VRFTRKAEKIAVLCVGAGIVEGSESVGSLKFLQSEAGLGKWRATVTVAQVWPRRTDATDNTAA